MTECLYLMNCTRCDDIQLVVEKKRVCECGESEAWLTEREAKLNVVESTGQARILAISFEDYDAAGTDHDGKWRVVREAG